MVYIEIYKTVFYIYAGFWPKNFSCPEVNVSYRPTARLQIRVAFLFRISDSRPGSAYVVPH